MVSSAFVTPLSPAGNNRVTRSSTPSPARESDATKKRTTRERSESPLVQRTAWSTGGDADASRASEKKRRVDDANDDDAVVLLKPSAAAAFDDMDEMMVDYEED